MGGDGVARFTGWSTIFSPGAAPSPAGCLDLSCKGRAVTAGVGTSNVPVDGVCNLCLPTLLQILSAVSTQEPMDKVPTVATVACEVCVSINMVPVIPIVGAFIITDVRVRLVLAVGCTPVPPGT